VAVLRSGASNTSTGVTALSPGLITPVSFSKGLIVPASLPDPALFDFKTGALDPRVTFTRASTATYINSSGLIASAAVDVARFDYEPITRTLRGLLMEEQRTNFLIRSEDFSHADWDFFGARGSTTADVATAPDGAVTADKLINNNGTTNYWSHAAPALTIGNKYAISVFLKAAEHGSNVDFYGDALGTGFTPGGNFNLLTGTINSSSGTVSITPFGNGWYRCTLVGTAASTTIYPFIRSNTTGDGASGIYAWGAQVEDGGFATSYIPTGAATIVRSPDNAQVAFADFTNFFRQDEGTFVAHYRPLGVEADYQLIVRAENAAVTHTIDIFIDNTDHATSRVISTATDPLTHGVVVGGTRYRQAFAYKSSDIASSLNGGAPLTDASLAAMPLDLDRLYIGGYSSAGLDFSGHVERIDYYSERRSNADLQAFTVPTVDYFDEVTPGIVAIVGQAVAEFRGFSDTVTPAIVGIVGQSVSDVYAQTEGVTAGTVAVVGQSITDVHGFTDVVVAGTVAIAGQSVTDVFAITESVSAGAVAITGQNVSEAFGRTDAVTAGAVAITGQSIADVLAFSETVSSGTVAIAGQSIVDVFAITEGVSAGTVSIVGQSVAEALGYVDAVTPGTVAITGQSVTPVFARVESVTAGTVAITGQSVADVLAFSEAVSAGAVAITGQNVSEAFGRTDVVAAGTVAITGQSVTDVFAITEVVSAGSVPIAGQNVSDAFSGSGIVESVTVGTVAIAGQSITDVFAITEAVSAGVVQIAGQAVTDIYARVESVTAGSVAITGQVVTPVLGHVDTVTPGVVAITGSLVSPILAHVEFVTPDTVAITGVVVDPYLTRFYALSVTPGTVPIVGQDIVDVHGYYIGIIDPALVPIIGLDVIPERTTAVPEGIQVESVVGQWSVGNVNGSWGVVDVYGTAEVEGVTVP
jgi:hypothetical protein